MLVLCRKCEEGVVVPQVGLVITVLEVRGNKVRLGFTAPPGVGVFRQEVWARLEPAGPSDAGAAVHAAGPANA